MRFVRYEQRGHNVMPGILDGSGVLRDISSLVPDIDARSLKTYGDWCAKVDLDSLPKVEGGVRLTYPIADIGKIVCVGLNYRDHAEECRLAIPQEPSLFLKPASSLTGPDGDLIKPPGASRLDWEVELGVVIGKHGIRIPEADAMSHIFGYCMGIDFSERDLQFNRGGQGFKGKSWDTFCPLGPWLVSADAVPEPESLGLNLDVNGIARQRGTAADMIFSIPWIVSYVSSFMSLHPGDVILTGTPAGVGMGQRPETYLQVGDVVHAWIDGLGEQTHHVRDFSAVA